MTGLFLGVLLAVAPPQSAYTAPLLYKANGLQVIHMRRAPATDVVAVQLYLLGGARQVTFANAGIEPLYLSASLYGTKNYPGERVRRATAHTGSSISVNSVADWTVFGFDGIKSEFDSTWAVFVDRLINPTLDSAAVEPVRARMVSAAARRYSTPEALAYHLADSLASRGHAYAVDPEGSEASLRAITAASMREYAKQSFVTSRMLLVVVGDVSREHAESLVTATLGKLPAGSYTWELPKSWKAEKPEIAIVDRQLATNYISALMSGPTRASGDFQAFDRVMGFLGGWVSYEVRERASLSYAAGVFVTDRGAPSAVLYMSTTNPDSAMKLVNRVLKTLEQDVMIPRSVLRKQSSSFALNYVRQTETASGQATLFARSFLYDGDVMAEAHRGDQIAKMDFPSMRAAIRRYAKTAQFGFVGDTIRLPRAEMNKRP